MEVILREDLEKLGRAGDVVSVKRGFARNFLLPRKLAVCASSLNLKLIEQEKKSAHLRQEREKKELQDLADKISSISCTITMRAGQDSKLFGSITTQDIAQAYKSEGLDIDRRKIELPQPIKEVGVFKIKVKLSPEIAAEAKVWVVKE